MNPEGYVLLDPEAWAWLKVIWLCLAAFVVGEWVAILIPNRPDKSHRTHK